jgi:flavin reductase (DIM6/NTAB) family NADH-FMN oxidoreductase RutF
MASVPRLKGKTLSDHSSNDMGTETPISSDLFKETMRLLAGGVCIVASNSNGERRDLTMTAVCSLTPDPPSLIACVNRDAGTHFMMSATRRVSVNILSRDQIGLAHLFSSSKVRGADRFDERMWIDMANGVPALVDALAVLNCDITHEASVAQDWVFIYEVKAIRLQPDKRPLVYFNRQFCALQPVC